MNLEAWLHQLLFEIKEDVGKTRLFFRKRENCFIHYLQTEGSLYTFTMAISDMKEDASIHPGLVDGETSGGMDLGFVGRRDEDETMIRNCLGIAAEEICIDVNG